MRKNSRRNNESASSLRVSRVPEVAEELSPPPSRIPMAKWQEILEDEEASHVAGFMREKIVRSAADVICEAHLRRAAYGFVVDCAYEAWMRAFRVIRKVQRETHPHVILDVFYVSIVFAVGASGIRRSRDVGRTSRSGGSTAADRQTPITSGPDGIRTTRETGRGSKTTDEPSRSDLREKRAATERTIKHEDP